MSSKSEEVTPKSSKLESNSSPNKIKLQWNFGLPSLDPILNVVSDLVSKIVLSVAFSNAIHSVIGKHGFNDENFYSTLHDGFVIQPNFHLKQISAYAWTDPFFNVIYISSNLSMVYAFDQLNFEDKVLFLVVKVVHEISNIINRKCCSLFKQNPKILTPEKQIEQTFKTVEAYSSEIVEKTTIVTYTDFGEMLELELFKGMIESTTSSEDFMRVEQIISYPTLVTVVGSVVDSKSTLNNFTSASVSDFSLVLGKQYVARKKPAFRGINVNLPSIRLFAPGSDDFDEQNEEPLPYNVKI